MNRMKFTEIRYLFANCLWTGLLIVLGASSVMADSTFYEKRTGGGFVETEGKVLISGDKLQFKRRLSETGAAQAAKSQASAMTSMQKMTSDPGMADLMRKDEIDKLKNRYIPNAEAQLSIRRESSVFRGSTEEKDAVRNIQQMKAKLAQLEAGGAVSQQQEVSQDMIAGQKERMEQKGSEESTEIETVRFDENRLFRVKPSKMTYREMGLSTERKQRQSRYQKQIDEAKTLEAILKDTGKTEQVGDKTCKVYEGGLMRNGAPYMTDRLCIAQVSPEAAAEYWKTIKRYALEVGPDGGIGEALLTNHPSYWDKLTALPGIPAKRTISMVMPDPMAQMRSQLAASGMSEAQVQQMLASMPGGGKPAAKSEGRTIELSLLSTDKIDSKEFDLPKGLQKE